jgi:ankyrin repeat protein
MNQSPRLPREPGRSLRVRDALAACALGMLCVLSGAAWATTYEDFNRAIMNDDAATVSRLLARGTDPNTANERGEPALMTAARESGPEVVRALLKARAKVNIKNQHGDTPIMLAALRGHLPIVKLLRQAGADVNQPGWTPLLYASLNGHNAVIEYLLSSGADLALNAPNGVTPVMLAVRGNKPETVKLLASYGFDVNAKNDRGETALTWARRQQSEELETVLRQSGAR